MNQHQPDNNGKPLRRFRSAVERREAKARGNGWTGPWPPEKPRIDSPADCEHYLARLESGEQRAGFLPALGSNLVAFFEHLQPEHFRRFAAVLLGVAENPRAFHRTRLRAVQAAFRPLRRAVTILPKLQKAGDGSLQTHLESLLTAFFQELSADHFKRLAGVLAELAEQGGKTASDKVRAAEAALTMVTDAMGMLVEIQRTCKHRRLDDDPDDPEARRLREKAEREFAEIEAEIEADIEAELEEERRTGKPGPTGLARPAD